MAAAPGAPCRQVHCVRCWSTTFCRTPSSAARSGLSMQRTWHGRSALTQLDSVAQIWRQVSKRIVYPGGRMSILWRVATGQDSLHDNRAFYQFLQDSGCTPALTFGSVNAAHLYVTATNLRTGRMHVFGDNPNDRLLDALMASTALTPLHPPWEVNGERYVDGGTVTTLPLRVALERGRHRHLGTALERRQGRRRSCRAQSAGLERGRRCQHVTAYTVSPATSAGLWTPCCGCRWNMICIS